MNIALSTGTVLIGIYLAGVVIGLITIDARGLARLGLAALWPLGPLAFIVTITILLFASLIAFPLVGAIALLVVAAFAAVRAC